MSYPPDNYPEDYHSACEKKAEELGLLNYSPSESLEQMLINDNHKLREAGCELAEAAMRVAKTYDGVHRLMIATSKWAMAIANEGGRGQLYSQNKEKNS